MLGWGFWGQRAGSASPVKAKSPHFSLPQLTICKMTELQERDPKGISSLETLWLNKTRPAWSKIFEWLLFLWARLAFFCSSNFLNKDRSMCPGARGCPGLLLREGSLCLLSSKPGNQSTKLEHRALPGQESKPKAAMAGQTICPPRQLMAWGPGPLKGRSGSAKRGE